MQVSGLRGRLTMTYLQDVCTVGERPTQGTPIHRQTVIINRLEERIECGWNLQVPRAGHS
jgi:hypothetical protein